MRKYEKYKRKGYRKSLKTRGDNRRRRFKTECKQWFREDKHKQVRGQFLTSKTRKVPIRSTLGVYKPVSKHPSFLWPEEEIGNSQET